MVGTEFSDVSFGQSLLDSDLSDGAGFSSFIYILLTELPERWLWHQH